MSTHRVNTKLVVAACLLPLAGTQHIPRAQSRAASTQGAAAAAASEEIRPFRIRVPDAVLRDLKERLARTRFPDEIDGSGWDHGASLAYMKELVAYWRDKYDWRKQEAALNAFPQF